MALQQQPQQPRTRTAPANRRGGTYEPDGAATSVLRYRTDTIHHLARKVSTIGSTADRDIVIHGEYISAHHCRLEQRPGGLLLIDESSKNGTYYEAKRSVGLALKPSFEEKRVSVKGVTLEPGMTFVVGALPHRFVVLDDTMRERHADLLDILGTEDEIRGGNGAELVSPSDLILAADSPGDMLITGNPGSDQEELVRIVHAISKRRRQPLVTLARNRVPDDRDAQSAILKQEATKATIMLDLGDSDGYVDPTFVSLLFSSCYQVRVIVLARTVEAASRALGAQYVQPMMQLGLRPLALRRDAIHRLLDRSLVREGSPLRIADLTPENQRALRGHEWRENLAEIRDVSMRLAAIARVGFSLNRARKALGIKRNTFYNWYGHTMRLSLPLVPKARAKALTEALATPPPASGG